MTGDTETSPKEDADRALSEIGRHTRSWIRSVLQITGLAFNTAIAVAVAATIFFVVTQRNGSEGDETRRQPLPVEVIGVEKVAGFEIDERYTGRIEARRRTDLAFDQGGRVMEILVDEGDAVSADMVVARLDDRSLNAERDRVIAQRDGIDAQIELAELNLSRVRSLTERGVASDQVNDDARIRLQQLQASRREVEATRAAIELELVKTELKAPFPGQVALRMIDHGAVVGAGTPVLTLLETSAPILRVGLPEARAKTLQPGQSVDVLYGGETVAGAVLSALPDLDPATQSVPLRIAFTPSPGQTVQFGDTAELLLPTQIPGPGFVLPLAALAEGRRGLWTVFAVDGDDRVGIEAMEIIVVSGDQAFARGSLRDGQRIVASGRHRISPGEIVAPIETKAKVEGS
ncbi:MAG: efflux RND transporter periplasmic adaptor subunit [Pseudomonadota bacterium]